MFIHQPYLLEQLNDNGLAAGAQFRALDHDGIATQKGDCNSPNSEVDGSVPRSYPKSNARAIRQAAFSTIPRKFAPATLTLRQSRPAS